MIRHPTLVKILANILDTEASILNAENAAETVLDALDNRDPNLRRTETTANATPTTKAHPLKFATTNVTNHNPYNTNHRPQPAHIEHPQPLSNHRLII